MRNIVVSTAIIMLSAVLLLSTGGNVTVSASHPTQYNLETTLKPTPAPHFASGEETLCVENKTTYSSSSLTIAKERQKGLMTIEIETGKADESEFPGETTTADTIQPTEKVLTNTPIASDSALPIPSITAAAPMAGSSGVLNAEVLFSLVNQTRVNAGLPAFEKHPEVCSVVASRAPELDNEIYGSSYMHAGFHARNLPFWATENMISQQNETDALNWWLNSPVHRSAILGSYRYACTACAGKSCAMIFSNLEPK